MEEPQDIKETNQYVVEMTSIGEGRGYAIPAAFGSNQQGGADSQFAISTSTPFMMITEKTCDNCSYSWHGKGIFNPESSETFQFLTKPDEQEDLVIGE